MAEMDEEQEIGPVTFPPRPGSLSTSIGPLTVTQSLFLGLFGITGGLAAFGVMSIFPGNGIATVGALGLFLVMVIVGAVFAFRKVHNLPYYQYLRVRSKFNGSQRQFSGGEASRFVPVVDITDDMIVLSGDRFVAILEGKGTNFALLSPADQADQIRGFHTLVQSVDFPVQVVSRAEPFDATYYLRQIAQRQDEEKSSIVRAQLESYMPFVDDLMMTTLDRRVYVVTQVSLQAVMPQLYAKGPPSKEARYEAAAEILDRRIDLLADNLLAAGIDVDRVEGMDLGGTTNRLVGLLRSYSGGPSKGVKNLAEMVAPSHLSLYRDHVVLDKEYVRVYRLDGYPAALVPGWLSTLLAAQSKIDVTLHLQPIGQEAAQKFLRTEVLRLQTQSLAKKKKGDTETTLLDHQIGLFDGLLGAVVRGEEHLYFTGTYITVRGNTYAEMTALAERVEGFMRGQMVQATAPQYEQAMAFRTVLPLGMDTLETHSLTTDLVSVLFSQRYPYLLPTSCIATMNPFVSGMLVQSSGVLYGINETNATPVIFDRFSGENYNTCIFGVSGAGKSYFAKLELMRYRMLYERLRTFIIDPLSEFNDIAQVMGGTVLKIGPGSATTVNPMWVGQDSLERSKLALQFFTSLLTIGQDEISILDGVLSRMYTDRQQEFTMEDVVSELRKEEHSLIAERLVTLLLPYVSGTNRWLSARTNVDLGAKVVCLDISGIDRSLFPAVMGLLLDYVGMECSRDQEKKLVFLDEAWYLLTKSASAKALAAWSRHSRHSHTGLTAISQSPLDFIQNEDGKVVLTNSAMVYLAKQKTVEGTVREHFGLTSSESSYLRRAKTGKDVGYSTGVLVTGNNIHTPLRVVSSEVEHVLATTNPEELRKRNMAA